MIIKGLYFTETSCSCPEQYDVHDENNNIVGYVRLRHGFLRCEFPYCGGETIYQANIGDEWTGSFENDNQRQQYLTDIAEAIHCSLAKRY